VLSFAEAWRNIPHSEVKNFFYNDELKTVQFHNIDKEEKRINGFSLFERNIKPEWEDVICEQGGEFRWDFKASLPTVQKIWERLVFAVVTSEFAEIDKICGVRLLDKSIVGKENIFRVEVWTKFSKEQDKEAIDIKSYVDKLFADEGIPNYNKNQEEKEYIFQNKFAVHSKDSGNKGGRDNHRGRNDQK